MVGKQTSLSGAQQAVQATHAHPCPSCGYCPTCGRGGARVSPYPWPYTSPYPWPPRPIWVNPFTYISGLSPNQSSGGNYTQVML